MKSTHTSGQIFGKALCAHFGLPTKQVVPSTCMSADPFGSVTVSLTIRLTPEDMEAIGVHMTQSGRPPQPPAPPLARYIHCHAAMCSKCGSSVKRTWLFFGPLKCIHPQCGHEA